MKIITIRQPSAHLQGSAFGPDRFDRIAAAYDEVLRAFRLANRIDPLTEFVAKKYLKLRRLENSTPRG